MKTMAMIAATMIASAGLVTVAQAQQTQPMLTGQEKAARYEEDQQKRVWHEQRAKGGAVTDSATFGAPDRKNFGRADPESATDAEAPRNLVIPGSGTAIYSYDANNKAWAYGY